MLTSSYKKTTDYVNQGKYKFTDQDIFTANYTGDSRIVLKTQIPNATSYEQGINLTLNNDYFVTFFSNNVAMTITNDTAQTICTLDSQNEYKVVFAKSGNPEASTTFYSSDNRYVMRSASTLNIENTDIKTGIISIERLFKSFV